MWGLASGSVSTPPSVPCAGSPAIPQSRLLFGKLGPRAKAKLASTSAKVVTPRILILLCYNKLPNYTCAA
ncbi:unnamed protein product [Dibothriocephalus latus]|uniref:Uncharacterized protein n=1 Tax=Dibothriocephalus latus TaxID=60516 RepID=A0A3P7Q741_DIBLA|nr:unnamed protein product [Dibothriocephalus latus]